MVEIWRREGDGGTSFEVAYGAHVAVVRCETPTTRVSGEVHLSWLAGMGKDGFGLGPCEKREKEGRKEEGYREKEAPGRPYVASWGLLREERGKRVS